MKRIAQIFIITFLLFGCKSERANKYYEIAYDLEEKDKYEEAIKYLDKAIEINPKFEQAYLDRAIDKSIIGDYEGAIIDLDKLIELRPDGIEPYVWRAEYKRMLDRYEAAIKDTEIALKLKKPIIIDSIVVGAAELNYNNPYIKNDNFDIELEYILYERAASNFNLGNYQSAFHDLNYCIQKNLKTKECKFMRGIIYLNSEMNEEGCRDLNDAEKMETGYAVKEIEKYCK